MLNKILDVCPFCGEDDASLKMVRENGEPLLVNGGHVWFVECLPCDARTGLFYDCEESINKRTGKELAIIYWNRRSYKNNE